MTSSVLVALRVRADPARTFDAFTREIGSWWRASDLFRVTPRGDGRLAFEGEEGGRLVAHLDGGKTYEVGRITRWAPPEELAFSWRPASVPPERTTHVHVTFEAIGDETRISVRHEGWAEIPRENAARHGFPDPVTLKHVGDWWRAHLAALRSRLA